MEKGNKVSSEEKHDMCHSPCTACDQKGFLDNEEICPACAGTGCKDKKYCEPAGGLGCES